MTEAVVHDLTAVDSTGWYERLLDSLSESEVLVEVFGPRGLGYLVLTGGRVESVAYDPHDAMGSVVDLRLPDGRIGRGPARLVVRRAIELVADQVVLAGPGLDDSDDPDDEALRAFLGPRFVLAAAMHGVQLVQLVFEAQDVRVVLERGEGADEAVLVEVPLDDARDAVRALVLADLRGLDGAVVDEPLLAALQDAERSGDARAVVALLEPVVGPLVSALRASPVEGRDASELDAVVRVVLGLADAYRRLSDPESAETVLRVAAQGFRGAQASAGLFTALGELALERGEPGEAVGFLRRGLTLAPDEVRASMALGRALELRGRHVGAYFVLERALRVADDADPARRDALERACARLRTSFGAPLTRLLEVRAATR